jgi:hypothetical protein
MCEYNMYAQCVQLGMPRSRSISLEGRLMNCLHGLPLQRYYLCNAQCQHDADPDPNFHVDTDPDPDRDPDCHQNNAELLQNQNFIFSHRIAG